MVETLQKFFQQRDPFRSKDEDTRPVINDKETQLWSKQFLIGTGALKNIAKEGEFYFLQIFCKKIAKKVCLESDPELKE